MNTCARLIWRRSVLILVGLVLLVACGDVQVPQPTSMPQDAATPAEDLSEPPTIPAATATHTHTPEAQAPTTAAVETDATASAEPVATGTPPAETVSTETGDDLLIDDDFTDSSSGWPGTQRFDAYYFGYHEPEWYHVEVQTPHEHVLIPLPEQTFGDAGIEANVFVETSLSEQEGNFRYGLALRRNGRQFYAFTVEPVNGAWAVLKSSPTSLETLMEGADDSIRGFDQADRLRVDALGSNFTFYINDAAVAQVHDDEYASGEIGFFVQTFDMQRVHIHYDTLTIREVTVPPQVCTVLTATLNLRPGPGVEFSPIVRALSSGTRVIPLTQSTFLPWIQVEVEGTGETGWIYAADPYASCNFDLSQLPAP